MDKTLKYQEIITSLLEKYVDEWSQQDGGLKFEVILDTVRYRYQIVCFGWLNDKYIHHTPVHLDIVNGKIWLQKNTTEEFVAEKLVEMGVNKKDIVLGLQPPEYRKFTDYAVA